MGGNALVASDTLDHGPTIAGEIGRNAMDAGNISWLNKERDMKV